MQPGTRKARLQKHHGIKKSAGGGCLRRLFLKRSVSFPARIKNFLGVDADGFPDAGRAVHRAGQIDTRNKDYESSIWQPRLTITSNYFDGHSPQEPVCSFWTAG